MGKGSYKPKIVKRCIGETVRQVRVRMCLPAYISTVCDFAKSKGPSHVCTTQYTVQV